MKPVSIPPLSSGSSTRISLRIAREIFWRCGRVTKRPLDLICLGNATGCHENSRNKGLYVEAAQELRFGNGRSGEPCHGVLSPWAFYFVADRPIELPARRRHWRSDEPAGRIPVECSGHYLRLRPIL